MSLSLYYHIHVKMLHDIPHYELYDKYKLGLTNDRLVGRDYVHFGLPWGCLKEIDSHTIRGSNWQKLAMC